MSLQRHCAERWRHQLTRTLSDAVTGLPFGGDTESRTYDGFGRVDRIIDFNGQVTVHGYHDPLGHLESKTLYASVADASSQTDGQSITFDFDKLNRRLQVDDARYGATDYTHDIAGRLTQVDSLQGTVRYEYEPVTGLKSATVSVKASTGQEGARTEFGYDDLGRLETVRQVKRNGGAVDELTTYAYNAVGSRASVLYPARTSNRQVRTTYG